MSENTEPIKTVVIERPGDDEERKPRPAVVWLTPLTAIAVRVLRTYIQSLVGFLIGLPVYQAAGGTGIPADTFVQAFITAASLAVAPAVVAFLMNALELLARLDERAPELRA